MNNHEQNLLGFLQRQSLFNEGSPVRKSRSRSHRSKDLLNSRGREYLDQQSRFRYERERSSPPVNDYQNKYRSSSKGYSTTYESNPKQQSPPSSGDRRKVSQSGIPYSNNRDQAERLLADRNGHYKITEGFESVHIQSFQCLQNISNKIWVRIIDINQKIDGFKRMVRTWMTQQLLKAHQSILILVEAAFKEQQALIESYVQKKQKEFTFQLVKAKQLLESEYKRTEELQGYLKGSDWRKAAGQIIGSNLQRKIEGFIEQTSKVSIPEWNPKSFLRDHLRFIELQLKEIFKLKTFP